MERAEVLVVGGGPAGSTCAAALRAGGLDVCVLDKACFPRGKVCAGWITPAVVADLGLDAADYSQGRVLEPMTGFRVGLLGDCPDFRRPANGSGEQPCREQLGENGTVPFAAARGVSVSYGRPVSFAIRRSEFDDYLLRRSGARLELGQPLRSLRRAGGGWIANEQFRADLIVAAGGHFCPVARLLGRGEPERGSLIASEETEFELSPAQQARCGVARQTPELYFCDDLLGYGWCLRKGNYLNIGLGRAQRQDLPRHVAEFCEFLKRQGRIPHDAACRFQGHAYLLYEQSTRPLVDDGVLWIGDAAGLAYATSGEGIHPAIESARMAAEVILAAGGDYRRERLDAYRRRVEARFGRRATTPAQRSLSPLRRGAGRWLLGRRWFVRHVVLDRWFLHREACRMPAWAQAGH